MKIHLERDLCCGSGQCALEAPEVFTLDDEGFVALLRDPADEISPEIEAAVASCPTLAISLVDQDGDS